MRRELEEKFAAAAASLTEPMEDQVDKPLADQGAAMVLAEPVVGEESGKESKESDAGDSEVHSEDRMEEKENEAMALEEPVAEQRDKGVPPKVARTDSRRAAEVFDDVDMRKAIAFLENASPGARVAELQNLLEMWRAVEEHRTFLEQKRYLRRVAKTFQVVVGRNKDSSVGVLSDKLKEAFVQRVSGLRMWQAMGTRGSASSASSAAVLPAPSRGEDSDAAELADSAEGTQLRGTKRKQQEGDLRRFMCAKTSEPALESARCQRIEDIKNIDDAWDVV